MISISHWGMFRCEEYPEELMLLHCGIKWAYLQVIV